MIFDIEKYTNIYTYIIFHKQKKIKTFPYILLLIYKKKRIFLSNILLLKNFIILYVYMIGHKYINKVKYFINYLLSKILINFKNYSTKTSGHVESSSKTLGLKNEISMWRER